MASIPGGEEKAEMPPRETRDEREWEASKGSGVFVAELRKMIPSGAPMTELVAQDAINHSIAIVPTHQVGIPKAVETA